MPARDYDPWRAHLYMSVHDLFDINLRYIEVQIEPTGPGGHGIAHGVYFPDSGVLAASVMIHPRPNIAAMGTHHRELWQLRFADTGLVRNFRIAEAAPWNRANFAAGVYPSSSSVNFYKIELT